LIACSILNRKFRPKRRNRARRDLRELKQSVRRDLEWLLNTRHSAEKVPEGLEEVNKSIAKKKENANLMR
jgi:predicted component of type VI protein secretion system